MRFGYFLIPVLVITSLTAAAQIGYGPELGFDISNYTGKEAGKKISNEPKYGGMFGGIVEIKLNDHFYLLPGLFYYRDGYATGFAGGTKTIGINTFELPLNIEYKFGPPRKVKFFVGAGPYFSVNQDGVVVVSSYPVYSTSDIKIGSSPDNNIKRFDVGMSGWGVYQVSRGLFLRARYQYGLLNMLPGGDASNSLHNRSFSLSVGYVFPGDLKARQEPAMEEKKEEQKEELKREKERGIEREGRPNN